MAVGYFADRRRAAGKKRITGTTFQINFGDELRFYRKAVSDWKDVHDEYKNQETALEGREICVLGRPGP